MSVALTAAAILVAACAAPASPGFGAIAQDQAGITASQDRVLTIAARYEVTQLLSKFRSASNPVAVTRVFNAALTLTDDNGSVRPYLAEALPQLNTDTWRVFPDGRMETTYKLRPGLTWHDGSPLSAEDFVFAWRVYTNASLGVFSPSPQDLMESVAAVDANTLVLRWRSLYPDAGKIEEGDFDPLPRHILDQPFASLEQNPSEADAFLSLPHWRSEYIGAGPYRFVRWEPGASFEGVAFDGHALGRPKIGRVIVQIIADDNVQFANLLAGTLDWGEIRFEQGLLLKRNWVPDGKGFVIFNQGAIVHTVTQQRLEYVGHPALLDLRVRRAMAHSIDRQAINDGVFDSQGFTTETLVPQTEPFYADVDRAITHYPYDPRRSEQLMKEAGFAEDRDGFFANTAGERFGFDFQRVNGSDAERLQLVQSDTWRRAGFEVQPSVLPAVQVAGGQQRIAFPGVAMKGGGTERAWISGEIGTPENRWNGSNTAGWSNSDYDRLYERVFTTLDRTERTRQFIQMQRLLSDQLPAFFMYFAIRVAAYVAALQGPLPESAGTGTFTPKTLRNWNIHEWEWR